MKSLAGKVALVTGSSRGVGRVLVAAELALEYGFKDIDGKQPIPLRLETA